MASLSIVGVLLLMELCGYQGYGETVSLDTECWAYVVHKKSCVGQMVHSGTVIASDTH